MEVWFRSFSFLNGWLVGSMLIFQGVLDLIIECLGKPTTLEGSGRAKWKETCFYIIYMYINLNKFEYTIYIYTYLDTYNIYTPKKPNKSCLRQQDLSFEGLMFLTGASPAHKPTGFCDISKANHFEGSFVRWISRNLYHFRGGSSLWDSRFLGI